MKHLLKTIYIFTPDKEIKNKEVLNLIQEREEIDYGKTVKHVSGGDANNKGEMLDK